MSALSSKDVNAKFLQHNDMTHKQAATGSENMSAAVGGKAFGPKDIFSKEKQADAYVSPSDAILSPASQKLAGFKQRQINKQQNGKNSTSRLLFARTPSSCSGGSDDIDAGVGKGESF